MREPIERTDARDRGARRCRRAPPRRGRPGVLTPLPQFGKLRSDLNQLGQIGIGAAPRALGDRQFADNGRPIPFLRGHQRQQPMRSGVRIIVVLQRQGGALHELPVAGLDAGAPERLELEERLAPPVGPGQRAQHAERFVERWTALRALIGAQEHLRLKRLEVGRREPGFIASQA